MASQTKASQIGWMFVPQYYTFVNKDPAKLHCFYTKKSTLIHGVEGEDCTPCYGQQEIHEKIMSLDFEDCKVFVSTVDSQSSAENGIVVQVVGELSNRGGPWRKFAQTFFLAEQPNGYFVLNDIFRYIKEESDDDEEEVAEAATPATSTSVHEQTAAPSTAATAGSSSQQSEPITNAMHDLDLKDVHGKPDSAAPVTVSLTSEHANEARASLEGLANGTEQQQVVELVDEIQQSTAEATPAPAPSASTSHPQETQVNGSHKAAEEEPTSETPAQEQQQPAKEAQTSQAEPTKAAAGPPQTETKPPTPAPTQPEAASKATPTETAAPAAAAAPAPTKPAAPKTWATLAASGQNKWNTTVKSVTQGVSSSVPASTSGSGSSTPVNAAGTSGQSSNAAGKQADRGEGTSSRSSAPRDATRTPQFMNVETGFSVIVHNVTADISHGLLRNKLSEEFAIREGGQKKFAKLSYLDIDRQKGVAYIDFEKEWGMKKAVEKGSCILDGVTVTIEAGKGNRRDASGFGTNKGAPPVGGKGRSSGGGGGGQGRDGARGGSGSGGGSRGGQQGREGQSSSRGGGRSGGNQRSGQ